MLLPGWEVILHSQPKIQRNVRLRVEKKETVLETVRRKGVGRELVDGGKRKIQKSKTRERVLVSEKAFPLLPWLQPA